MEALHKENVRLRSNIKERYRFGKIIGKSPVMQEIYELIIKAAASNVGVIVYGESGTGKELVAEAIHEMSDRKENPLFPSTLVLFRKPSWKASFSATKKGPLPEPMRISAACSNRQTKARFSWMNWVKSAPICKAKLLRAIEGGGFTPVGGLEAETSDFRIIAATNQD